MNSILENLYLGDLRPSDQVNPQCREYREVREKRSEKINLVMEGLITPIRKNYTFNFLRPTRSCRGGTPFLRSQKWRKDLPKRGEPLFGNSPLEAVLRIQSVKAGKKSRK